MPETWQVWVAIYAAIVATGALTLEVRRWVEGRARLYVSATPGMSVYSVPSVAGKEFLTINVTNRGGAPATLQVVGMQVYPKWWHRVLRRPSQQMVIANPSIPGTNTGELPHLLQPGAQWTGAAAENEDLRGLIESGSLYVAVHATHRNRPVLAHVRLVRYPSDKRERQGQGGVAG